MPRKNRTASPAVAAPRPLTDFQETVCNLAADLILNGGAEANIANLLRATIGHSLSLQFPEFDAWHCERIAKVLPDWTKRISRFWPTKAEPAGPGQLPNTVTGMLRANLRGKIEEQLATFLAKARMQELHLMHDVLENFENSAGGSGDESAESALAEAFMYELDSDDTYVKVPRDRVEAVEEFLETIDSIPDVDAAPAGRPKLLMFPARAASSEAPHAS
jgi:hypothetical protein